MMNTMSHAEKSDFNDSSNAPNEANNRQSYVLSTDSFEILRKYRCRLLKINPKSPTTSHEMQSDQTSSTIRVAAENFIQSVGGSSNELSLSLANSVENLEGIRLIQNLLFCAEKVAMNQYELALKFLKESGKRSLSSGTPIQRLVFYFSEALSEKIANETGRIMVDYLEEKMYFDPVELVRSPNIDLLIAFQREHPLAQVTKLVGIQAVLDHVKRGDKVHVIDLQITSGVQWIFLMQDLAARGVRCLKITAVGTECDSTVEETGRQLAGFASSVNLEFSYKKVVLEGFLNLDHTQFGLEDDESVVVYAPYALAGLVGRVNELDHLMKTMRILNPCVVIVMEFEVNCNSPTFIDRFVESLFFFGAFFDSLEDCFRNDEASRASVESCWFGPAVRNILAADGDDRRLRHVSISVWRAFFARFGLAETELSASSLDQALVGVQSLPCGRSCSLYKDGKSFIVGWKGNPLISVSAWRFC